ncbi:hypothetical protein [Luteibacter aegosomatissinici]|uniref:hypothetical protein n=1 Tax=Luteibacter aegosomatissinici TaxID=2911539 RepID=UPI001FF80255|nr:hypothetical protein [Luteibacter aegosomatissinici]UPG92742.1 hypothetical protein L2Y97_12795 [Luteibacter aegosomatissinici]
MRDAVAAVDSPDAMADGWAVVFGAEILLTNLGNLSLAPVFGDIGLEAVWGPAVATGIEAEQTLSALGFGGRLHLAHTSFQPLPGFLDAVVTLLDEVVEG